VRDRDDTYDLCEGCISTEGGRAARRPLGAATAAAVTSIFAGFALLGLVPRSPSDPTESAIRQQLDGLSVLSDTLSHTGFPALGVVAALIIAVALSLVQSARRIEALESETLGRQGVVQLHALRQLRAAESVHRGEMAIALLCMAVTAVIAAAAVRVGTDAALLAMTSCLCLAWLAVQLGLVQGQQVTSSGIRVVLDAPFRAALRDRVAAVRTGQRWVLGAWWAAYLAPLAVLVALAPPGTGAAQVGPAVISVLLFGALTEAVVTWVSSTGLVEDGWGHGFTVVAGTFMGVLLALAASFATVALLWDVESGDVPLIAWGSALVWYSCLGFILARGAAGDGALRAVAQRSIGSDRTAIDGAGVSTTQQAVAWTGVVLVACGAPTLIALVGGEPDAGLIGIALAVLLALTMRVTGFALHSPRGAVRTGALVIGGSLIAVGAVLAWSSARDHATLEVASALCYLGAATFAWGDIAWGWLGARCRQLFIDLQARRYRSVVQALATEQSAPRRSTCDVPGCLNERRTPDARAPR